MIQFDGECQLSAKIIATQWQKDKKCIEEVIPLHVLLIMPRINYYTFIDNRRNVC